MNWLCAGSNEYFIFSDLTLSLSTLFLKSVRDFLNIFSNSVDALISQEKDNPTFSIGTYEENNILTLKLSDNGPGIPEQIKDKLFQPFATYGKYNGTGLGMAQVKGIIEAHNGNVSYTSNTEGTTFYLKIPISREVKSP